MTVRTHDDARLGTGAHRFLGLAVYGVTALWNAADDLYQRIQKRRGVEAMLELEDSLLRDIGVTRDDVRWASRLPLSHRAGEELSRVSKRRSTQRLS